MYACSLQNGFTDSLCKKAFIIQKIYKTERSIVIGYRAWFTMLGFIALKRSLRRRSVDVLLYSSFLSYPFFAIALRINILPVIHAGINANC